MATYELMTKLKGPLQNLEDWWRLCVVEGQMSVEHEWAHTNIDDFANPKNGLKTFTVTEFLESGEPDQAKDRLKSILKDLESANN